jgi:hypothetical protein
MYKDIHEYRYTCIRIYTNTYLDLQLRGSEEVGGGRGGQPRSIIQIRTTRSQNPKIPYTAQYLYDRNQMKKVV